MAGDEVCGSGVRPVVQAEVPTTKKTTLTAVMSRFVIPILDYLAAPHTKKASSDARDETLTDNRRTFRERALVEEDIANRSSLGSYTSRGAILREGLCRRSIGSACGASVSRKDCTEPNRCRLQIYSAPASASSTRTESVSFSRHPNDRDVRKQ
jgi:hypothetical protein